MSTRESAAALGITIGSLQQLIFRGIIQPPTRRFGPAYVWNNDEIEAARRSLATWRARRNRGGTARTAA